MSSLSTQSKRLCDENIDAKCGEQGVVPHYLTMPWLKIAPHQQGAIDTRFDIHGLNLKWGQQWG